MIQTKAIEIIVLTFLSGLCILLGGFFAAIKPIFPRWIENEFRHFIIALGGGLLLGAVAIVLIPEGLSFLNYSVSSTLIFLLGGILFFGIETYLGLRKKKNSPQLMGMLLDYIPEAIALGGLMATGSKSGLFLALLIGLQNIPEGFNAYREIKKNKTKKQIFTFMSILALFGPLAGLTGFYLLANHLQILGAIMLLASGGILYIIFQDIAPQSRLNNHWLPPLGAVIGFTFALLGNILLA